MLVQFEVIKQTTGIYFVFRFAVLTKKQAISYVIICICKIT